MDQIHTLKKGCYIKHKGFKVKDAWIPNTKGLQIRMNSDSVIDN